MTYACVIDLPDFLNKLKEDIDESEKLFVRNVRLAKEKSPVNKDIKDTYLHYTREFFFGNNGIHIICTKARFGTGMVEIYNPSIINGGQTLRTLRDEIPISAIRRVGKILARITEIPESIQSQKKNKQFVDDVIFRSNNNNKMEPWDLRSNDEIQVRIANELHHRRIYYERKESEWKKKKAEFHDIKMPLSSVELAQITAVCTDEIGPAKMKAIGVRPLFKRKRDGGYYEQVFKIVESDFDLTETKIHLNQVVFDSVGNVRGIPRKFKTFNNASANYALGIIWRAIESSPLNHPLSIYTKKRRLKTSRIVAELVKGMFKLFRADLESGSVTQNDIFRKESYWEKAKDSFITHRWKSRIMDAIKNDSERRTV
jgi:hypothetical protein